MEFREKKTSRVWYITNAEHIKHFRSNPRFEEIKESSKKVEIPKKPTKENKEESTEK